jgi:type I restriction enzyme S subunit
MIEELEPYPAYADSGFRTVRTIPAHWRTRRAKVLFREVDERSTSGKETMLSVSHISGVRRRSEVNANMFLARSNIGHKLCRPNDLVINTMWAWMGALGVSPHAGVVSPSYGVYRPRGDTSLLPGYVDYMLRAPSYVTEYNIRSSGIHSSRLRLYPEHFLRIPIVVPPAEEQSAIVRFLDHASRRIDRYIRAKRKLIALLGEQKQAIIYRVVTHGLDPNVPMTNSRVAWLGEIPEHWKVWRVSQFARVGNGSTPSRARPAYWNGGTYPWLNSSQVNRGHIYGSDQFVTNIALSECHLPRVAPGSVLVAITGQGKTRGMAAVLGVEATINQHLAFITPRADVVSSSFLHLAFVAAYSFLRAQSEDSGSTKGALTCEDLKRFKMALPPIAEQAALVDRVVAETEAIQEAVRRTEREIALLSEYRTRLIADVVTGQLDVREAAARLPAEEPDQPAPSDLDDDAAADDDPDLEEDAPT